MTMNRTETMESPAKYLTTKSHALYIATHSKENKARVWVYQDNVLVPQPILKDDCKISAIGFDNHHLCYVTFNELWEVGYNGKKSLAIKTRDKISSFCMHNRKRPINQLNG